jgi:hypothetical protein
MKIIDREDTQIDCRRLRRRRRLCDQQESGASRCEKVSHGATIENGRDDFAKEHDPGKVGTGFPKRSCSNKLKQKECFKASFARRTL